MSISFFEEGEQNLCSSESTPLRPMWPGFDSRIQKENYVVIASYWDVYHLSTKNESFGWKFKWYSSFHRKVSEKDGNLQTYSSFPVPTGMTGKWLSFL